MGFKLIITLLGYIFLYYKSFKKHKGIKLLYVTVLYFYVCLILNLTIIPDNLALKSTWKSFSLPWPPKDSLRPYYDFSLNREGSLIDIILNVLMMIPFGYLLAKIKKSNVVKVVIITLLFSISIELTQLLMSKVFINHRFFDVTDIINNTIGGLIGYIIYKLVLKTRTRF